MSKAPWTHTENSCVQRSDGLVSLANLINMSLKQPAECRGDVALCSRPLGRVPCEGNQRKRRSQVK